MVKCIGRGLVVKRPGVLSKVQMLNLVLGVGVFSLLPKIPGPELFCDLSRKLPRHGNSDHLMSISVICTGLVPRHGKPALLLPPPPSPPWACETGAICQIGVLIGDGAFAGPKRFCWPTFDISMLNESCVQMLLKQHLGVFWPVSLKICSSPKGQRV